jgi:hypothetical protein
MSFLFFFPECDQEVEWLKEAGYEELVKKYKGRETQL